MTSQSKAIGTATRPVTTVYVGMDVHKDSVMVAVLPVTAPEPTSVDRLPNDLVVLRRRFARLARNGVQVTACYEASGAGYVLQRAITAWGHECIVVAPSMTPTQIAVVATARELVGFLWATMRDLATVAPRPIVSAGGTN
jgi:transposase